MFSGSIPALATPFCEGALDESAYRRFIDWQIDCGSSALVPCGTTGESATLDNDEHHKIIAAQDDPISRKCGWLVRAHGNGCGGSENKPR